MDNRPMIVQMKPRRGRRRMVVSTDMVSHAIGSADHFNIGNAIKGLGKVAGKTNIPFVSQGGSILAGATGVAQKLIQKAKAKKAAKKAPAPSSTVSQTPAEQLTAYAQSIPNAQITAIKNKANALVSGGMGAKLTKAQKQLSDMSASIVPKTKAVKDAEEMLTAPIPDSASGLSFKSPWVIGGAVAVVVVIIVVVAMKRK